MMLQKEPHLLCLKYFIIKSRFINCVNYAMREFYFFSDTQNQNERILRSESMQTSWLENNVISSLSQ